MSFRITWIDRAGGMGTAHRRELSSAQDLLAANFSMILDAPLPHNRAIAGGIFSDAGELLEFRVAADAGSAVSVQFRGGK